MSAAIEVRGLSKVFMQGREPVEVLHGLDWRLESGETAAVLGSSGSGKSTLLALLAGLDHPTAGEVILKGQRLAALNENDLTQFRAKTLSIVFQQFHLMSNMTALENAALPLELAGHALARQRAEEMLESVGLASRQNHFPRQLSGGECQRVAIARAMVYRPAILLADEPSGNLDERTGAQVMNLLFELVQREAITLVLVMHNPDLAKRCRSQWLLSEGKLSSLPSALPR